MINKIRALGSWYTKGLENGSHLRTAINSAESLDELRDTSVASFSSPRRRPRASAVKSQRLQHLNSDADVPALVLRRAVFLDRDGVLNRLVRREGQPFVPSSLESRNPSRRPRGAGASEAAEFLLIVTTNQPDVARGHVTRESVETIHEFLRKRLPLDDICVCYHVDEDRCACRKPQPGMLFTAAVAREIQLPRSFMVGDRWRDIGAGKAAGCTTVLVNSFPDESAPPIGPDIELPDLPGAADWILHGDESLTFSPPASSSVSFLRQLHCS